MTITINGVAAAILDVMDVTIDYNNMAPDEAVIDLRAESTFDPAYDDLLTISQDGVQIFRGRVSQPRSTDKSGSRHSSRVMAKGPWWNFERVFWMNPSTYLAGLSTSEVVAVWEAQAKFYGNVTVKAVMDLVSRPSWDCADGTHSIPEVYPPETYFQNALVSEAMLYALRYLPGLYTWFNYTLDLPTFNSATPGISDTSFTVPAAAVAAIQVKERPDLKLSGVVLQYDASIHYKNLQNNSDQEWGYRLLEDSYPPGSVGGAKDVLTRKINVGRLSVTRHVLIASSLKVKADARSANGVFRDRSSGGTALSSDWVNVMKQLGYDKASTGAQVEGTTVTFVRFTSDIPAGWTGFPDVVADWGMLMLGKPPDTALYKSSTGSGLVVVEISFSQRVKFYGEADYEKVVGGPFYACMYSNGTRPTGTIDLTTFSDSAPTPAAGIAQQLYTARNSTIYEGTIKLVGDKFDPSILGRNRLDYDGTSYYGIQQIRARLYTGQTDIKIGPPNHLGPQDMIELARPPETR